MLRDWIGAGETLGMSAVAWAEFLCGPLDRHEMGWAAAIIGRRGDFTPVHAETAARLFNRSGRRLLPTARRSRPQIGRTFAGLRSPA